MIRSPSFSSENSAGTAAGSVQKMVKSISTTVRRKLQKQGKYHSGPQGQYLVTFIASGFVSTIHEWLMYDDCSPAEIAAVLLEMMCRFEA